MTVTIINIVFLILIVILIFLIYKDLNILFSRENYTDDTNNSNCNPVPTCTPYKSLTQQPSGNNGQNSSCPPQIGTGQPQMGTGQPQMGTGQPQVGTGQPNSSTPVPNGNSSSECTPTMVPLSEDPIEEIPYCEESLPEESPYTVCRRYCGIPLVCPDGLKCVSQKSNYKKECNDKCGRCECR